MRRERPWFLLAGPFAPVEVEERHDASIPLSGRLITGLWPCPGRAVPAGLLGITEGPCLCHLTRPASVVDDELSNAGRRLVPEADLHLIPSPPIR